MFQGFIHPLLAWGALLAAVPLLIHLFNRQRHKPMQWAAMEFVLAAYKRTRRRAQLENLLLLLLRMAAVALLALAVARPFTGTDSPLAPLTESRRDLVLIVDASASTGYRDSVRSVFETSLDRAREILDEFDGTRGDRVRLYASAARPRMISARSPEDALSLLSTLNEPTDEDFDLAATLMEVVDFAEEEAAGTGQSSIEVRLLSDLQRNTFEPTWSAAPLPGDAPGEGADDQAPPLRSALDRLDELGVRVVVEDVGPGLPTPPNLGVVSVEPLGEVLGPGVTTELGVRVANRGSVGRAAVRVRLVVDGDPLPFQRVDVAARSETELVFQVVFPSSGPHEVVARLEGDRLAVDDARSTVVQVPPPIRVLLVNGDPHPELDRDEIGFLRAVLEPLDDASLISPTHSPFSVTVVDASSFGAEERELDAYDLITLANVSSLSERVARALEERVAAGTALFVTLGDRSASSSAVASLNGRLWNADGTGLLPAKLFHSVVTSRSESYYRCATFDAEHPVLRFFADERWRPFLTEVPVYGFVSTEPISTARVLARLDDEAKSPLLLEREFGRGRVLLWTTSIDRDWNRAADSPSTLIPLVHELFRYASSGPTSSLDVGVGDPIVLETRTFPRNAFVVQPDGTRRPLDGEPLEVTQDLWNLPPVGPLERVGSWRVEYDGGFAPFAVQLAAEEGDLDRITPLELEGQHRAWHIFDRDEGDGDDDDVKPEHGELWRWLAGLALAALVCETLWSAWIGRGRRLS
jgi:hypothetical protein